jgi:polysaccharide deacetylase family protein (PEP-CTERM system associated)
MTERKTNALTIDVEEHYHAHALARCNPSGALQESRVVRNTEGVLALLDALNIKATFFVLGRVAERQPNLVRGIHGAGHEVASHGWSHSLIYQQTQDEFRAETIRAKKLLEDTIGASVAGYRASTFSVRSDSLWALEIIAEAGFEYDSSIAPVRHDLYGLPASPAVPYRVNLGGERSLLEFPVATISLFGARVVVGGGGYFRLLPYSFIRAALRRIEEDDAPPFLFYVHPWEFDPDQPRAESLPMLSRIRHYTNLDKTKDRFKFLLSDFSFSSIASVLARLSRDCATVSVARLRQ